MIRKLKLGTLRMMSCAVLLSLAPALHAACSNTSVAGSYGYTASGFLNTSSGGFVPVAAAGRIVLDNHGNVTGTQTRAVAGTSLDETYSGTYNVNADCTASFTATIQPDTRTSTVNLVFTDNANGGSAVFTTPGFTLSAVAHRIVLKE